MPLLQEEMLSEMFLHGKYVVILLREQDTTKVGFLAKNPYFHRVSLYFYNTKSFVLINIHPFGMKSPSLLI